jgi:ribosomal protein L11 methyltransferase
MSWLEVKIRTDPDDAEALEDLLLAAGAVSVTLTDAEDQPLFEPPPGETPLWQALVLTGLFPQDSDPQQLWLTLAKIWAPATLPHLQFSTLPDQDWVRAWLDDFKPLCFGRRLWVCPSWWLADDSAPANTSLWQPPKADASAWKERNQALLQVMQKSGTAILRLDPGLAFGTGTHPTTSLCLQWLDDQNLQDQVLADYGCGSGILGIAALLLGATTVYGVDNDPQALVASADNLQKNELPACRFPLFLPADYATARTTGSIGQLDGLLANILAGTLIELAPLLAPQVRSGGWVLLSGILREQAEAVMAAWRPWYGKLAVATEGDWVRISGIRQ